MLENRDLDDLAAIADSLNALPGRHFWMHGTADIFYCPGRHIGFEFGADPVPQGPCGPLPPDGQTGAAAP